jgi:hypothetical protein
MQINLPRAYHVIDRECIEMDGYETHLKSTLVVICPM